MPGNPNFLKVFWPQESKRGQKLTEIKLDQLECLRSEDTLRRLMITHAIRVILDPKSKQDKSQLQI